MSQCRTVSHVDRGPFVGRAPHQALHRALAALGGWLLSLAALGTLLACCQLAARSGREPGDDPNGGAGESPVWALTYSPDGDTLASVSVGGCVSVVHLASGRGFQLPCDKGSAARCVAFSPDGGVLGVVGHGPSLLFYDGRGREARPPLTIGGYGSKTLAFSPDGVLLAVAGREERAVTLWDWAHGRQVGALAHAGVRELAFAPTGSVLAIGDSAGLVTVWDVATGRPRAEIRADEGPITALAFSPDGAVLASGGAGRDVRLWDAATGAARGELSGDSPGITALAFTPDGAMLASAQWHAPARLWDVRNRRVLAKAGGPGGPYQALALSPDGYGLATGGADGAIRVWDLAPVFAPDRPRDATIVLEPKGIEADTRISNAIRGPIDSGPDDLDS